MLTKSLILFLSAKFNFESTIYESQIIWCDFIMDADVLDRSADHPWSLSRVTGRNLDPGKYWYVLTNACEGSGQNAFAKNGIFLKPATRVLLFQPKNVYVATFGLCAALLRQREFPAEGFPVVDAVNRIALDCEMLDSLGGKSDELQESPINPVLWWALYTWGLPLTCKNIALIYPVLWKVVYTWGLQLTCKNIALINSELWWVVYTWGLQLTYKNIALINSELWKVVYTWGLQLTCKNIALINSELWKVVYTWGLQLTCKNIALINPELWWVVYWYLRVTVTCKNIALINPEL